MKRLFAALITAFMIGLVTLGSAQAAVAVMKLKDADAQEQAANPGKVTVNFTLTRTVLATEDNIYTVVLYDDSGRKLAEREQDPGSASGRFTDIAGRTDTAYRVTLIKRVAGRPVPVQVNAKTVTTAASTPTPNPASSPTVGPPNTGTTIPPASDSEDCFKFGNTVFGNDICAQDFLTRAYLWAVGIAIIGAAGMIIYAGYKYAVSRGNPSEVNNAKEIIISTLVGLALLVVSFTILQFFGVRVQDPRSTTTGTGTSSGTTGGTTTSP